ncbi:MAG: hypothetical protein ABIU29_02075 [Chthoniobacterales bacterium]
MTRSVITVFLTLTGLVLLVGCATDDDNPFPNQSSAASDEPIPGATAGPRENSSAGWKW